MSEEEEKKRQQIKNSVYISSVPGGGTLEITYRGRVIAKRTGDSKIEHT